MVNLCSTKHYKCFSDDVLQHIKAGIVRFYSSRFLLRARRVKLLVTVRKVECRTIKSYLSVCVCVSVNDAVRCSLHVLSAI